jgi:hypothetical protein
LRAQDTGARGPAGRLKPGPGTPPAPGPCGLLAVLALLPILYAAAAALGGCSRVAADAGDVRVAVRYEPDPPVVGRSRLLLLLADSTGRPVAGARLRVVADMDHPGMVPSVARPREDGHGRYRADLEFTMRGDWHLLIEGELADGRRLERTLAVPRVDLR